MTILRPVAMRDAFLDCLWQSMREEETLFFLSADFGSPVLDRIRRDFPERFVNVGLAEQNLINVSAGLALEGYTVFAYAIAPFITMRCFEQIRVNLALLSEVRRMNVTLIGVGAGYSYVVSGPTHQCYEDLTLMRSLPNFRIYSPADHVTARAFYRQCIHSSGPKYLRLDAQVLPVVYTDVPPDMDRGFSLLRRGEGICLVATGYMVHTALQAADRLSRAGMNPGVIDLFKLTDFDPQAFRSVLETFSGIVTLEEGFRGCGGLDAMIFDFCGRRHVHAGILNIGVEGKYRFELGTRSDLHEQAGIGIRTVETQILSFVAELFPGHRKEVTGDREGDPSSR